MGSIPGAALGAVIVGLAEQLGSVYIPTYAIVVTFLIMVLVLAVLAAGPAGGPLAMAMTQDARLQSDNLAAATPMTGLARGDFGNPAAWSSPLS